MGPTWSGGAAKGQAKKPIKAAPKAATTAILSLISQDSSTIQLPYFGAIEYQQSQRRSMTMSKNSQKRSLFDHFFARMRHFLALLQNCR